jgi:hypothetical protein
LFKRGPFSMCFLDILDGPLSRIISQFVAKSVNDGAGHTANLTIELLYIRDEKSTMSMLSKTEELFTITTEYVELN